MRNILFRLLLMVSFISCEKGKDTIFIASVKPVQSPCSENNLDYQSFKDSVAKRKSQLKNHSSIEISDFLYKSINQDIFCYWNGTPWEFYGTTQKPKSGSIACGYFVTNTLSDLGFKIDRIALAKMMSGNMIKILCTDVKTFHDFNKMQSYLKQQPNNSVFIIGLDFHTGYILKDKTGNYFLHSNYINNQGVVKQKIESRKVLQNSKIFMVGSLTGNSKLLKKWTQE